MSLRIVLLNKKSVKRWGIFSKNQNIDKNNFQPKIKSLINQGYNRIYHNNEIVKLNEIKVNKIINFNDLFLVIDRIICNDSEEFLKRVADSLETAIFEGKGKCIINNITKSEIKKYNTILEADGIRFKKPDTNFFSFNNPHGACKKCEGYGSILGIDKKKVIKDEDLSVYEGVVAPWSGIKLSKWKDRFIHRSSKYDFPIHKPFFKLFTNSGEDNRPSLQTMIFFCFLLKEEAKIFPNLSASILFRFFPTSPLISYSLNISWFIIIYKFKI